MLHTAIYSRVAAVALAALPLALMPAPARACSVCGCGDPLVNAADAMPTPNRIRLSLGVTWLTASARSDDEPSRTEGLVQESLTPLAVYSPARWVNLVLQVPLERKLWRLHGGGVAAQRVDSLGLGDLSLSGRFFLWQHANFKVRSRQNLGVFAGSTLPTGPNGRKLNGQRIDDHAQLGTGAFGPFVGLFYAYHRDPWNLFTSVSGSYHNSNSYGYQYASALLWTVRGQWRPMNWLAVELGFDGRFNGRDNVDGDAQVNTGGLVLAASPGFLVQLYAQLWLHVRGQLPFYKRLNGVQTVGPVLSAFVQYAM